MNGFECQSLPVYSHPPQGREAELRCHRSIALVHFNSKVPQGDTVLFCIFNPALHSELSPAQLQLRSAWYHPLQYAVSKGLDLAIHARVDDGRSLGGWRNTLDFDPLQPYYNYSYFEDIFVTSGRGIEDGGGIRHTGGLPGSRGDGGDCLLLPHAMGVGSRV